MRKSLLNRFITLLLALLCIQQSKAQFKEGVEMPPVFGLPALTGSALIDNATNTTTYANQGEASANITNIVTLKIKEGSSVYFATNFTATADLALELKDVNNNVTTQNLTLTVQYDKTEGAKYALRDYKAFKGYIEVKVTVSHISITGNTGWDPGPVIEVENEMRITRNYTLSTNTSDLTPTISATQPTPDVLNVSWSFPANAHNNMSELEWAYVESEMLGYYNGNYDLIFNSNSTRVDLDYSSTYNFNIPLLFPGPGKLYYRTRAVQRKGNGNLIAGPWSGVSETQNSFAFDGHEGSLNWQSSTAFAEGGKYKSVIQYFDGSLRSRQTVTKDNSTGNTIVGETLYDLQGRPNVQILPTPTIDNTIKYFQDFNRFTNMEANDDPAKYFDLTISSKCNGAPGLDNNFGNGRYYSGQNDWLTSETKSKYIPDAQGYAYTETRFTDDATQRVKLQGGVGLDHQINSGHETKYFYGKPSQTELDALFGTEVGDASHYFKNMVQDANGQMSVSYVDMHGRTIATALAGLPTPGIESISNQADYPMALAPVRNDLLTPATNIIQDNSIVSVNTILVPARTDYDFTYELNPEILHLLDCSNQPICFDCKYDLEISIKSENCDNDQPVIRKYNNLQLVSPTQSCSTSMGFTGEEVTVPATVISFHTSLDAGSYVVRKTLTLNDSLYQIRKAIALDQLLCRTQQQLYDSVYNVLLGTSGCGNPAHSTCDSCLAKLGDFNSYKAKYLLSISPSTANDLQIHIQFSADSIECSNSCSTGLNPKFSTLKGLRNQMLADMVPFTGQYATDTIIKKANGEPDLESLDARYNIFSSGYTINSVPYTSGHPFYNKPQNENGQLYYFNDLGAIDNTIHGSNPGSSVHIIDTITMVPFANIFQNSWTNSLIKYHPEYSKLNFAETNMSSAYEWLDNFQNCTSYQAALTNGFTVPVQISTSTVHDPYFLLSNTGTDKDTINYKLYTGISYNATSPTIWQIANSSVLCSNKDSAHMLTCITQTRADGLDASITADADKDKVWDKFKSVYLGLRSEMVLKYINDHAPNAISQADMAKLIAEGKQLVFANNQQIANQNGWTFLAGITNPNGPDTSGLAAYQAAHSMNTCEGQRPFWKARLLQCEQIKILLGNGGTDSSTATAIINTILDSLVMICHNSVTSQQPYGATNVNPAYSGQPRKFEDVINNVFNAHGIHTVPGNNYFCNPFTIDFPKPFGSNPQVSVNYSNTVDTCACKRFTSLKAEAIAAGFNSQSFSSMNQFLLANYNDSLTLTLWNGLQQCNNIFVDTCHALTVAGSSSNNSDTCRPAVLNVSARSDYGQPAQYIAKLEINFLPGFESLASDSLVAFTDSTVTLCDSICPKAVITSIIPISSSNSFHVLYQMPQGCDSCNIYMYNSGNSLVGFSGNICSTQEIWFSEVYSTTNCYKFLIKCYSAGCGEVRSDTAYYNGCTNTDTCLVYRPIILPDYVPMPPFLNCGYIKPCITCSTLVNVLTPEFRTLYSSYAGVPYLDSTTTDDQAQQNALWARFLNYRTGFSKNAIDYLTAYKNCTSNTPPVNAICALDKPLNDPGDIYPIKPDTCKTVKTQALFISYLLYEKRKDSLIANFDSLYKAKCLNAKYIEQFYAVDTPKEYHYTLYYYDQGGNLVKTIPPSSVRPNYDATYLANVVTARNTGTNYTPGNIEVMATEYRYNSLNQVVTQQTPDAGVSHFWYDGLGRLVVSQNSKQASDNKYSYTLYDNLGRITEVGQKPQTTAMTQATSQVDGSLQTWLSGGSLKEQITHTVYDVSYFAGEKPSALEPILFQRNLRNRVSYTQLITQEPSSGTYSGVQSAATYYSYDIHGNVDTLVQDLKDAMASSSGNRHKKMVYDYDLVSGKVNQVSYQPGFTDQFFHKYWYDDENRLVNVTTSNDNIYWENDASYEYYRHGPLSRMVLGANSVQGLDYAYTIQGWLKGVNSSAISADAGTSFDMGQDGIPGGTVARDAFAFNLNYFNGDYKPIGGSSSNPFVTVTGTPGSLSDGVQTGRNLFNGNISSMMVNIPKAGDPLLYAYRYDQLNRIKGMNSYTGFANGTNDFGSSSTPTVSDDYKERVTYDPNGNIRSYIRNGAASQPGGLNMDNLTYGYNLDGNGNLLNNRLRHVKDDASFSSNYPDDIDNQADDNYSYDAIGNLTVDVKEGISNISWNVYGKIESITKTNGTTINYTYDPSGNRISKAVTSGGVTKTTRYIRDASGNVMSIYITDPSINSGALTQTEADMYGSSRLGVWNVNRDVSSIACIDYSNFRNTFIRGNKFFELSNHLGNVLVTISDKQIGVDNGTNHVVDPGCNPPAGDPNYHCPPSFTLISGSPDGVVDYYTADVITANDFYPFGMQMPGRKYTQASTTYRYGFNGKERDNEIKGEGNAYDFGARIQDPRLGRWFSPDPLQGKYPSFSPYNFCVNNPLVFVDYDGRDIIIVTTSGNFRLGKETLLKTQTGKALWNKYATSKSHDIYIKIGPIKSSTTNAETNFGFTYNEQIFDMSKIVNKGKLDLKGDWSKNEVISQFNGQNITRSKGKKVSFIVFNEKNFDEKNPNAEMENGKIVNNFTELEYSLAEIIFHEIKSHIDLHGEKDEHKAYGKKFSKVFDNNNLPTKGTPAEKIKDELYDNYNKGFMDNPTEIKKQFEKATGNSTGNKTAGG